MLEQKLSKIEAVLMFEDEDFEQVTGVKKQEELDGDAALVNESDAAAGHLADQSSPANVGSPQKDGEDANKAPEETPEQKFERQVLEVQEDWRDTFREAQFYIDELRQEIFEPSSEWSNWQDTKNYSIKVGDQL